MWGPQGACLPKPHADRLRVLHLVALDANALMARLDSRHQLMLTIFSRQRDRAALLDPLRSVFYGASFADLAALEPGEQTAVFVFYEALDSLRWYLQHTTDMPGQLEVVLTGHRRALVDAHLALMQVLVPAKGPRRPVRRLPARKSR